MTVANWIIFGLIIITYGLLILSYITIALNSGRLDLPSALKALLGDYYNSLYNCINSFLSFDNTSLSRIENPFDL